MNRLDQVAAEAANVGGRFVQLNPDSRMARSRPVGYIEPADATGCWDWVGSKRGGYGDIWIDGKVVGAHRWMWERRNGPVPAGLHLDHFACSNRGCVNPDHMRPVTPRENILRGAGPTSHHASKTHCPQGHALSGDNLVSGALRRGARQCRTCARAFMRQYMRRRRAALRVAP